MKSSNNTCIRVFADENQIVECKKDLERISQQSETISKALGLAGNQVRLNILFLIHKEGQMCPCDLSDVLNMSVPSISQHLRKLKDGGILRDKKVGQTVFYSIVDENTTILMPILNLMIEKNLDIIEYER